MARLSIATMTALGPLSVEVLGPRGERVGKPIVMSSLRQQTAIDVDVPGDYLVVATRPSGEQLVSTAKVGPDGGQATIEMAGRSPREFLTEAAAFGLAYGPALTPRPDFLATAIASPRAANTASRSMSVLVGKANLRPDLRLSLGEEEGPFATAGPTIHQLVAWTFHRGRWRKRDSPTAKADTDYLQVKFCEPMPVALGLFNRAGFGPIVIVPPFLGGVTLTFLAAGVAMPESADRAGNPSAVRVPVALVTPNEASIADLLVGLNASVLPQATQLFEEGRSGDPEAALEYLAKKFQDAAAAVLGALFLARFAPARLPLPWLYNLSLIRPDIADTWLLLAWARSVQGDGGLNWEDSIPGQVRRAQACRCTLFSRTRYQLSQLGWRYGPYPRARQAEVASPRRPRIGDYLDFAAEAGGVEAYWGYAPNRPGLGSDPPSLLPEGRSITMRAGRFTAVA